MTNNGRIGTGKYPCLVFIVIRRKKKHFNLRLVTYLAVDIIVCRLKYSTVTIIMADHQNIARAYFTTTLANQQLRTK